MNAKPLNVALISSWFENPYKDLLIQYLSKHNVYAEEYFQSIFFVPKVLSKGKPDILHLQTLHDFFVSRNKVYCWVKFLGFITQLLFLKLIGVKTVWTVHEWTDKITEVKHNILPLQALILGKVLSAIITHCESTRQEMITALHLKDGEKVFVIFHGNYVEAYDNKISRSEARQLLNIPDQNFAFLMFGGIHKGKGTLDGIESFKHLNQENLHLIVAGKVSKAELRNLILQEIEGEENVIFTAPPDGIPDEQIQVYMNACDCVVLPYKIFTTSGVAVLAMSYSKVCIAPCSGFFKEILDDQRAFLYNPDAKSGLVNAMNLAIEQRFVLAEIGQHNFEVAQAWNWDYVATATREVYQWCLHY
ncbi:MAG: glycosyltransferase family 4 protein [Microcoleaceae cyanobacterium]